jgi:hypothetical protein
MTEIQREGGCFCGSIRHVTTGEPSTVCLCHCESCRFSTGAPMVAWATFPMAQFRILRGEPVEYASSPGVSRLHCPDCGTSLTYTHEDRPGEIDVTVASFDDASALAPSAHIWVQDKLSWLTLADGLPQFPTTLDGK